MPVSRSAAPRTRADSAGSIVVPFVLGFCLAPAQRARCSAALTDIPSLHDLAGEPAAAFLVGNGQHGARMALTQLAALDHGEDVGGQVEQAHPVRHRRLDRPTRSETSPIDSPNSSIRSAQARASSTGDRSSRATFSTSAEQERIAVVGVADDRRDGRQSCLTGGPPAPFARDQLEPACGTRADDHRLDQRPELAPSRQDRARPRSRGASVAAADWGGSSSTGSCGQLGRGSRPRSGPRGLGRGPSDRACGQERSTSSIATFQ